MAFCGEMWPGSEEQLRWKKARLTNKAVTGSSMWFLSGSKMYSSGSTSSIRMTLPPVTSRAKINCMPGFLVRFSNLIYYFVC